MEYEALKMRVYELNEDELFYKKYYYARQQQYSLEKFFSEINMQEIKARHLIILEKPETLPDRFEDSFFFDLSNNDSIVVQRHNRFSPDFSHTHTFFELIYVYDGKCIQSVAGSDIEMHTGDICIIPPNISHSIKCNDESVIINIMIRKNTLHTIFQNFLSTSNALSSFFLNNIYAHHANDYILFHTGFDTAIKEAFLRMLWENQNKERYYFQAISSTLTLVFYLLIRDYENSIQLPSIGHKLDEQRYAIIQYMQENYKDISLQSIADRFHYTSEYTSRIIKKSTNMTYSELLLRIRIEKAEDLLINTNLSVAAIAEEIGYDTTEHFIRQFKKYSSTTPTAYRRLNVNKI